MYNAKMGRVGEIRVSSEIPNGEVVAKPPHAIFRHLSAISGLHSIIFDIATCPISRIFLIRGDEVTNNRGAP